MKLLTVFFALVISTKYFPSRVDVLVQAIVYGSLVDRIEDYNFMVGLWYYENSTYRYYYCGGAIVSPWKVVTAAHCIYNKSNTISVIAGTLNINETYQALNFTRDEDVVLHPEYAIDGHLANDIAVINLRTPLKFSSRVDKVEMVDEGYMPNPGDHVTVLGYTESEEPGRIVKPYKYHLRHVNSTIANFERCKATYGRDILAKQLYFCVSLKHGKVHLSNKGDSGSPAVTRDKKYLGIVSYDREGLAEVFGLIGGYRNFISNPRKYRGSSNGLVHEIEDHKYMAVVMYKNKKNTTISSQVNTDTCGAAILSNVKILTAAHCLYSKGAITLAIATVNTDEPFHSIDISEGEIFIHPEYSKGDSAWQNDIALIILRSPLKFGSKIDKIEMVPTNYVAKPGENVQILGYSESNSQSRNYFDTHLRYINSTMADFEVCRDGHSGSANLERDKQFCLMVNENTNKKYAGGVIISETKKFLGIISYSMNEMTHVCTSVTGYHRAFIDNPRVFRPGRSNVESRQADASSRQASVPSRQTTGSSSQTRTESHLVLNITDHKYTAGLLYQEDSNGSRYLCSATIIANNKVLAAAHCVQNKYSVTLELGTIDTDKQYITVNVSKQEIIVHPNYSKDQTYINDIAVILLKKALKFDSKICKIDMVDKKYVIGADDKVTVFGHSIGYLRYFNKKIDECRSLYWEKNNDYPWLEEDRQFCLEMHSGDETIGSGCAG
ncbi:uncharacterized protein LOC116347624, partial [Contarinia nasturtii]|uniref:uncharacterized protein LOC116347624 n=1 Tax=Contarinia nasturtii TaxID=265458 RepID=UPI0012D4A88E